MTLLSITTLAILRGTHTHTPYIRITTERLVDLG